MPTFCESEFKCKSNLKKHIKAKHTEDEERQNNLKKCNLCDFTTHWSLNKHMRYVHKDDHKHKSVWVKCQWKGCDYKSHKNAYLDEHVISIHEGTHKCGECGYETPKMLDLKSHQSTKHEPNKHFCDQCSKTFLYKSRLEKHMESVHGNTKYPCDQCSHASTCQEYLVAHIRRAHGSGYQCDFCEHNAKSPTSLKSHIATNHGQENNTQTWPENRTTEQSDSEEIQNIQSHSEDKQAAHFTLMHSIFTPAPTLSTTAQHLPNPIVSKVSEKPLKKVIVDPSEYEWEEA